MIRERPRGRGKRRKNAKRKWKMDRNDVMIHSGHNGFSHYYSAPSLALSLYLSLSLTIHPPICPNQTSLSVYFSFPLSPSSHLPLSFSFFHDLLLISVLLLFPPLSLSPFTPVTSMTPHSSTPSPTQYIPSLSLSLDRRGVTSYKHKTIILFCCAW